MASVTFQFMNRPVKDIMEDIKTDKLPANFNRLDFISWCITVEEFKHPRTKEPRKAILKTLYKLLNPVCFFELKTQKSY